MKVSAKKIPATSEIFRAGFMAGFDRAALRTAMLAFMKVVPFYDSIA